MSTNQAGSPGRNLGHGHVHPRPDGELARCGGPAICPTCAADQQTVVELPPRPSRDALDETLAILGGPHSSRGYDSPVRIMWAELLHVRAGLATELATVDPDDRGAGALAARVRDALDPFAAEQPSAL